MNKRGIMQSDKDKRFLSLLKLEGGKLDEN